LIIGEGLGKLQRQDNCSMGRGFQSAGSHYPKASRPSDRENPPQKPPAAKFGRLQTFDLRLRRTADRALDPGACRTTASATEDNREEVPHARMSEENGPAELVRNAKRAAGAGFAFAAISDHFSPWLAERGHAPLAWPVLGAVANATWRLGLMMAVICPSIRYHPAIVAQSAATLGLLSDNRFTLGLGAGERLNEHIVGALARPRGAPQAPRAGDRDHPGLTGRHAQQQSGQPLST
jgi:luciferase-like monooxygenase